MPSNLLLSSKVVIQEEDPAVRQIEGVPTAVPGFIGVTERGPFGPTFVTASNYRSIFGSYTVNGDVIQALDGYFTNGGSSAYVSRIVHYTDATDPTTKTSAAATRTLLTATTAPSAGVSTSTVAGPWDAEPGQTLVVAIDGGADQTVTLTATAALRDSADGGDPWPKTLANGQTLTVQIDGGATQTITFATSNFVDITAATAVEVAAVINAGLLGAAVSVQGGQVRIQSDKRGTGSSVNVTGGTSNAVLSYTTGITSGTGNVANIDAVTLTEINTIINAGTTGNIASVSGGVYSAITSDTTGGSSSVQVKSSSTFTGPAFDNAVHTGLAGTALNTATVAGKTDGSYANSVTVLIEAATNAIASSFNLRVVRSGLTVETWPNLTMVSTDARYVETIVNHATAGSNLIAVTDLEAATTVPNRRPVNGSFALSGGSDGLTSLADADFIGGQSANGRVGLRSLDLIQDLSLLVIPGRATSAVHNAMISYCQVTRLGAVFAVLDPPANTSGTGIVTYVTTTAALEELSEFAAIYWPRIKVSNPNKAVFGTEETITVPPSGHICGVMARNDSRRQGGIYDAPAGVELGIIFGCLGFETDEVLDEEIRDLVYPHRINPITTSSGRARYIDGSYSLKSTGNFPTVSERRGVIFIEQSVKNGIQFARHRNNDETLRANVSRTVTNFLETEMKKFAFRTTDPATAFYVDFGPGLNPATEQFAGRLNGKIGLATQKPVQWAILTFTQDTRSLQAT